MHRIDRSEVIVHAVKDILLIALVMEDRELRGIEKAAGVQAVSLDEIPPLLAVGLVTPCPERVVATITRLVLPPYSAGGAPLITSMD